MSIGRLEDLYREPTLADLGDRLAAQLTELSARPTRDGCDHMLMSLTQARTAVAQVRTRLERNKAA